MTCSIKLPVLLGLIAVVTTGCHTRPHHDDHRYGYAHNSYPSTRVILRSHTIHNAYERNRLIDRRLHSQPRETPHHANRAPDSKPRGDRRRDSGRDRRHAAPEHQDRRRQRGSGEQRREKTGSGRRDRQARRGD